MNIGIDIDNTISYSTEVIMHYAVIFGKEHDLNTVPDRSKYYLEDTLGWSSKAVEEFFLTYLENVYREVKPKEQAGEIIRQLGQENQIVLITSRNRMQPGIEDITRDWLSLNDIPYNRLVLNTTNNRELYTKLPACKKYGINVMIEDQFDLAGELSRTIPVVLFNYPYNQQLESRNIMRVNNWLEVKDCINRLPDKK